MRWIRFLAFALFSFVAALFGALLSPSTWLHKSLAVALCGVLSANPALCTNNAVIATSQFQEASATNPVKVETTQSHNLLAQRSRDFDDDAPKSPTRPNPKPPSYQNDSGANIPLRRPDFDDDPNQQVPNQQSIIASRNTFFTPSFRKISSDKFELEIVSAEGCKFINTIVRKEDQIYQESIKFIPSSIRLCKAEAFTANLQPNGERIEIKMQNSNSSLVIEKISSNSIKRTFTNSTGKSISEVISIPEKSKNLFAKESKEKSISPTLCKVAKSACEVLGAVTGLGAIANLSGAAIAADILVANPATAPVAALVALAGGVACFAMFGGVPPIFSTLGNLFKEGTAFFEMLDGVQKALDINGGITAPALRNATGEKEFSFGFNENLKPFKDLRQALGCDSTPPEQSVASASGSSWGDPHLVTFDGLRYDHQSVGEFILSKSTDGAFEIQVREAPVAGSSSVSLNTAAAMKVGNTRVAFYAKDFPDSDTNNPLRINGKPTIIQGGSLFLPNGGSIIQANQNSYIVQWPTGEQVSIETGQLGKSGYLNVNPGLPQSRQGKVTGLLGDFNGNQTDDLRSRDGQVLPPQSSIQQVTQVTQSFANWIPIPLSQVESLFLDQLNKQFGDSWRISQAESLFDYPQGKNTDSYTNRAFPNGFQILRMLLPQQVQMAEQACRTAGVPAERLEGCLFDVGATGDVDFANVAANIATDFVKKRINEEIQRHIPIPIQIPGLSF